MPSKRELRSKYDELQNAFVELRRSVPALVLGHLQKAFTKPKGGER